MLAIWLQNEELRLRDDLPVPEPAPGEALVRVLRAGICNTDLEMTHGYYPFAGVLGHEFVGVVEHGPDEFLGKRVVGEINAVCGKCLHCQHGRRTHCANRTVLGIVQRDGAFAEYLTLPYENLHTVPGGLATDAATFVEPVAAALQIQEQISIGPHDQVLLVGAGKLGQLIAQTLVLTGCDLCVVSRNRAKLDLLERSGIATVAAVDIPAGEFNIAVDCTGNAEGFSIARSALRSRGTLVLKSTYAGRLNVDASDLVVDEITVLGSRCGPFAPALRLLAEGQVQVEPLIHARYGLAEGLAAFERAQKHGTLKVLLTMESVAS
jgi:threonine dehydrogenase-like Zn-dependent dehydrogenase